MREQLLNYRAETINALTFQGVAIAMFIGVKIGVIPPVSFVTYLGLACETAALWFGASAIDKWEKKRRGF